MSDQLDSDQPRASELPQPLANEKSTGKTNWGIECRIKLMDLEEEDTREQDSDPFKVQFRLAEVQYTRLVVTGDDLPEDIEEAFEEYGFPQDLTEFSGKLRITAVTVDPTEEEEGELAEDEVSDYLEAGVELKIGEKEDEDDELTETEWDIDAELIGGYFVGCEEKEIYLEKMDYELFRDPAVLDSINPEVDKEAEEQKPIKAKIRVRFELLDSDDEQLYARDEDGFYEPEEPGEDEDEEDRKTYLIHDVYVIYEPRTFGYNLGRVTHNFEGRLIDDIIERPFAHINSSPPWWVTRFRDVEAIIYTMYISHELRNYLLERYYGFGINSGINGSNYIRHWDGKKIVAHVYEFPMEESPPLNNVPLDPTLRIVVDNVPTGEVVPTTLHTINDELDDEYATYLLGFPIKINAYVELQRWILRNPTSVYEYSSYTISAVEGPKYQTPIEANDFETGVLHSSTFKGIRGTLDDSVYGQVVSIGIFESIDENDDDEFSEEESAVYRARHAECTTYDDISTLIDEELKKQLDQYEEVLASYNNEITRGEHYGLNFDGYEKFETTEVLH